MRRRETGEREREKGGGRKTRRGCGGWSERVRRRETGDRERGRRGEVEKQDEGGGGE